MEGEGLGNLLTRYVAQLTLRILDAMGYLHSHPQLQRSQKTETTYRQEVGLTCKTYPGLKQNR